MIHPTATTRDASDTLLGCLMTSSLVGRPRRHARGAQALASRRPAMSDRPSRGSTARHAITCGHAVENRRPAAMVKETANMRQSSLQACSAAGRHTAARRRADDGRHLKGHRRRKCSYRAAVRAPAFSAIKTTRKSSYLMSGRCTLTDPCSTWSHGGDDQLPQPSRTRNTSSPSSACEAAYARESATGYRAFSARCLFTGAGRPRA